MEKHLRISAVDAGKRVDQFLAEFPEVGSRTQAQRWIENGFILVNGRPVDKSYRLRTDDELIVQIRKDTSSAGAEKILAPVDLPLPVLYEDAYLLIINKPSGLVTHPSLGHWNDSVVHRLVGKTALSAGGEPSRPGIVHRLDRETSGLMVVAKDNETHRFLALQFQRKTAIRRYQAVVSGKIRQPSATICSYLARHSEDRKRRASLRDQSRRIIREKRVEEVAGKWAVTHYRVLKSSESPTLTWVDLKLDTGRTHQIRVHMSELGHPVVGDFFYHFKWSHVWDLNDHLKERLSQSLEGSIFLHAYYLEFQHPRGERLRFQTDWPEDKLLWLKTWFDHHS